MKKLPIGIQSFVKIRSDNYHYVDKTRFVHKLVNEGSYYFLSRPRRFGKSLFIDTLRQAFLGRKELFDGLFLESNWNWDSHYPVLSISFGAGVIKDLHDLEDRMDYLFMEFSEAYGIELKSRAIRDRFSELIKRVSRKTNQAVVILIDEYDKPILDHINIPEQAETIRDSLKNFYSVIKDCDEFIKFALITGVSKFSKVSLFSGLNNLEDITLSPHYGTLCGYTQSELEVVFQEKLVSVDLGKLKKWYDGYHYLSENVYNPFDILLFLRNLEYRNYWFETATPTFLIDMLQERKYFVPPLEQIKVSEEILGSFDVERILFETLLFQTGYLTIKEREDIGDKLFYTLGFPNHEVKTSLYDYILTAFVQDPMAASQNRIHLSDALNRNDIESLEGIFHAFFASIPHDWYRKNQLAGYEGYYASIFYCYFTALGLDVRAEDSTNHGRIDMSVGMGDRMYIFEFKVNELIGTPSALDQIKRKGYGEKYIREFSNIYLIGIEFSKNQRNIVLYEWEHISS